MNSTAISRKISAVAGAEIIQVHLTAQVTKPNRPKFSQEIAIKMLKMFG
jgi:hypothetical protein